MSEVSRRSLLKGAALGAFASFGAISSAEVLAKSGKTSFDEEADVVVVGFGGAGATTAIVAADNGASVIVLERQPKESLRSNTRMSAGIFHCPKKDGNYEALVEYSTAMFSGANPKIPGVVSEGENNELSKAFGKAWADYSPKMVDWMKSLDPEFNPLDLPGWGASSLYPRGPETGYAMVRSSYPDRVNATTPTYNGPKEQACAGEAFWRCLETGCEKRADKIKVHYETRGMKLITNEAGEVVGVVALQGDKEVSFHAKKGVVLCSGGYEFNPQMRKAFLEGLGGDGWAFYGTPFNEGDGIRMGLDVGAGLQKCWKVCSAVIMPAPVRFNGLRIGMMTSAVGSGHSVIVNNYGKRFANEDLTQSGAGENWYFKESSHIDIHNLEYKNTPCWFIFDEKLRKQKSIVNVTQASVGYGFVEWGPRDNSKAIEKGWIMKADSIEELAKKIAADPENAGRMDAKTLVETVKGYNEACKAGVDKEFGRSKETLTSIEAGPFYAVRLVSGGPNTKGGLATNGKKQVVDWFDKPITGLYAVGEIACGMQQSGAMLTDLLVFGHLVGEEIVKENVHKL